MRIGVTLPFSASDGPGRPPTWLEMRAIEPSTLPALDRLARAIEIRGH